MLISKLKKIRLFALSAMFSSVMLWLVFKSVNLDDIWDIIKNIDYRWVVLSGIIMLLSHIIRAYRWRLLLQSIGYFPSMLNTTISILSAYFINLAIPRGGEFARCGSLFKSDNVPFEKSFGTVVAERLVDFFCLILLILINFLFEFNRLKVFFIDYLGAVKEYSIHIYVAFLTGILIYNFWYYIKIAILKIHFSSNIIRISAGIWVGLKSLTYLEKMTNFIFSTILMWVAYYLATFILLKSLPDTNDLSLLAGLTILVMGSIGMAIPSQSGVGTYHFFVSNAVVFYGIQKTVGITLATFLHASQNFIFVPIFGCIALVFTFLLPVKKE